MASGDGLIVRVRVPPRGLTARELRALVALSSEFGSGLLEVTRRGKLQLRGVRPTTLGHLQRGLVELGLSADSPVVVNPFADLAPGAAPLGPLADAISEALAAREPCAPLSDKFAVALDRAGLLRDLAADIHVDVAEGGDLASVRVAAPGPAWSLLGTCRSQDCPQAVAALAAILAGLGPDRFTRMRDLVRQRGVEPLASRFAPFAVRDAPPDRAWPRGAPPRVGFREDIGALVVGIAFGSGDVNAWGGIADLAERLGRGWLRVTPFRTAIVPGVSARDTAEFAAIARSAGLILEPHDPLLRVVACPGSPACASAHGPTRSLARSLLPLLAAHHTLHVSGCGKGCASGDRAAITLVCDPQGARLGLEASAAETASQPALELPAVRQRVIALAHGPSGGQARARRHPAPEPLMPSHYDYERDGAEIYRRSFAIIRREAALDRFTPAEERVAVRLIHTSGMVELAADIAFSAGFTEAASNALRRGAPILCDAKMVASGVTRARLPAENPVLCFLEDPSVPSLAAEQRTTRSAAALELWREHLAGALVAIGNAPTALFHLLELLDLWSVRPAAIIGVPVGFVGAAESKQALLEDGRVPSMIVRGRKGGSAMAVAAINALARDEE